MLSNKTMGFIVQTGSPQSLVLGILHKEKKMLFRGSGSWASKTAPTWQLSCRLVHTTPFQCDGLGFPLVCLHLLQHALYFCEWIFILVYIYTSLNPVPNAQVCVYLTVHITKLQLQTTVPKSFYIPHFACIHGDPGR